MVGMFYLNKSVLEFYGGRDRIVPHWNYSNVEFLLGFLRIRQIYLGMGSRFSETHENYFEVTYFFSFGLFMII